MPYTSKGSRWPHTACSPCACYPAPAWSTTLIMQSTCCSAEHSASTSAVSGCCLALFIRSTARSARHLRGLRARARGALRVLYAGVRRARERHPRRHHRRDRGRDRPVRLGARDARLAQHRGGQPGRLAGRPRAAVPVVLTGASATPGRHRAQRLRTSPCPRRP